MQTKKPKLFDHDAYIVVSSFIPSSMIIFSCSIVNYDMLSKAYNITRPFDSDWLSLVHDAATKLLELPCVKLVYSTDILISFVIELPPVSVDHKPTFKTCKQEFSIVNHSALITGRFMAALTTYMISHYNGCNILPFIDTVAYQCPDSSIASEIIHQQQIARHKYSLKQACIWESINRGASEYDANSTVSQCSTVSALNELLFNNFSLNYNNYPEAFKKGLTAGYI